MEPIITYRNYYENLPEKWVSIALSNICEVKGGKRIPAGRKFSISATKHKYLRVTDMKNLTIRSCVYIDDDIFELIKNYTINYNNIYITVAGTIGEVGLIPIEYDGANLTENADKLLLNDAINKNWFLLFLQSEQCQKQIRESMTKVGQPKLAIKRIESIIVHLPPIKVQELIFNKTNYLLKYLND